MATANLQHASPAGYSAHWPNRGDYSAIGKQQVFGGFDVMLGGGRQWLLPEGTEGGRRKDGENLITVLRDRGYALPRTADELLSVTGGKVFGLFAQDDMAFDLDRSLLAPSQPSLSDMTTKALSLLAAQNKGFFLFVEGSKIDWAAHSNDPAGIVSDLLAFDRALGLALDFASRDGHTLVLAFADHATGGFTIGSSVTDSTYSRTSLDSLTGPLRRADLTAEGLDSLLGATPDEPRIRELLGRHFGLTDLSAEDVAALRKPAEEDRTLCLGHLLSRKAGLGWTTTGHTGEDLFLYAYGWNGPLGLVENTEIARMCARALGVNLDETTARLFAPADSLFPSCGASWKIEGAEGPNPRLLVEKAGLRGEVLLGTDQMILTDPDGKPHTQRLPGVAVFAPRTGRVFLPKEAAHPFGGS